MGIVRNVVRVEDLRKSYGRIRAVDGVSFEVREGEVFSLLGPNGAGKTTIIEILEGIRKKDSGRVEILGYDVESFPRRMKSRIRVMFQETTLMENLTVAENLRLFSRIYGVDTPVDGILQTVGLKEREKTLVRKLSGGQKRRLSFAITLLGDPDLVFLDEPTTGLDPQARRMVWDMILDMKRRGKTVFLTTHYMDEAERLSDRICIIDRGRVIAMGNLAEIMEMAGLKSVVEYVMNGETFSVETDNPEEELEKIFKIGSVEKVVIRKPNLEDVFLKLTGRSLRD